MSSDLEGICNAALLSVSLSLSLRAKKDAQSVLATLSEEDGTDTIFQISSSSLSPFPHHHFLYASALSFGPFPPFHTTHNGS